MPTPPARTALPALDSAEPGSVEDTVRWGASRARVRPADARRSAAGFAEGDRFRYQKIDYFGSGGVTDYLWRIDRIEPDGALWVNGGRQRLDPSGQRLGGNDEHTGVWLDLAPALPVLALARRGAGVSQPVSTTMSVRDYDGRVERITLSGTGATFADVARGPRGMSDLLTAVRVEFDLSGNAQRSDGMQRTFQLRHTYWMALPILLPISINIVEIADGLTRQNTRHDLIAIDQLSLADEAPRAGGTR
jgi:hypothetical protein